MDTLSLCKRTLWYASMCIFFSTHAVTLYVTNLLDNDSPGSLRTTIENAASGDTILFNVSGTIFLDASKGELVIDKSLTIDGEEKITIDGQDAIATGLHLLSGAENSNIQALTLQHFSDGEGSEITDVHGILIDSGAENSIIQNCTIQQLSLNNDLAIFRILYGIRSQANLQTVSHNTIASCVSSNQNGRLIAIDVLIDEGTVSNNIISECRTEVNSTGDSNRLFGIITVIKKGSLSHNTIENCSTGDSSNNSGFILGALALITQGTIESNLISNCSTGQAGDRSGGLSGLSINAIDGLCSHNTISHCSTGQANNISGPIVAIQQRAIQGACTSNNCSHLSTGTAFSSGPIIGIDFGSTTGSNSIPSHVANNKLTSISSGHAINRGYVQAIAIQEIAENSQISCNTIQKITGGKESASQKESTIGLLIEEGDQLTIQQNNIDVVNGESGQFTSGIQLGVEDEEGLLKSVTNSNVSYNTISNINDIISGFGITIISENSLGNSLLSNSIFNTSNKAINILDNFFDGQNISSFTDAIVTLSSVTCTNRGKIHVSGTVEPQMGLSGQSFLIQFFVSDTNPPSQAKTLIFEYVLTGSEDNTFDLTFTPAVSTSFGQYISATATAQVEPPVHNWNTSEVSNALPACNSTGAPYSPFICPEPDIPTPPFDCNNCLIVTGNDSFDIL